MANERPQTGQRVRYVGPSVTQRQEEGKEPVGEAEGVYRRTQDGLGGAVIDYIDDDEGNILLIGNGLGHVPYLQDPDEEAKSLYKFILLQNKHLGLLAGMMEKALKMVSGEKAVRRSAVRRLPPGMVDEPRTQIIDDFGTAEEVDSHSPLEGEDPRSYQRATKRAGLRKRTLEGLYPNDTVEVESNVTATGEVIDPRKMKGMKSRRVSGRGATGREVRGNLAVDPATEPTHGLAAIEDSEGGFGGTYRMNAHRLRDPKTGMMLDTDGQIIETMPLHVEEARKQKTLKGNQPPIEDEPISPPKNRPVPSFQAGDQVSHPKRGAGKVVRSSGACVSVQYPGKNTLIAHRPEELSFTAGKKGMKSRKVSGRSARGFDVEGDLAPTDPEDLQDTAGDYATINRKQGAGGPYSLRVTRLRDPKTGMMQNENGDIVETTPAHVTKRGE